MALVLILVPVLVIRRGAETATGLGPWAHECCCPLPSCIGSLPCFLHHVWLRVLLWYREGDREGMVLLVLVFGMVASKANQSTMDEMGGSIDSWPVSEHQPFLPKPTTQQAKTNVVDQKVAPWQAAGPPS